jgi:hypothetical protein
MSEMIRMQRRFKALAAQSQPKLHKASHGSRYLRAETMQTGKVSEELTGVEP